MRTFTYNFNVEFSRPDEQDLNVYTVGFNREAESIVAAEESLRAALGHLTIRKAEVVAIFEGGEQVW